MTPKERVIAQISIFVKYLHEKEQSSNEIHDSEVGVFHQRPSFSLVSSSLVHQ